MYLLKEKTGKLLAMDMVAAAASPLLLPYTAARGQAAARVDVFVKRGGKTQNPRTPLLCLLVLRTWFKSLSA